MNLQEISDNLPNGFHDSYLKKIEVDFLSHEAQLFLDVWVGNLSHPELEEREAMRSVVLKIKGLVYWVMESPGYFEKEPSSTGLRIDIGQISTLKNKPTPTLPQSPQGSFSHWLFISNWNSFIYFCGMNSELIWNT